MNWKDDKEFCEWYDRFYDMCCRYGFETEYLDPVFLFSIEHHHKWKPEDEMIELLQDRIETDQNNLLELQTKGRLEKEDNE